VVREEDKIARTEFGEVGYRHTDGAYEQQEDIQQHHMDSVQKEDQL
jgi:hypothetical protein